MLESLPNRPKNIILATPSPISHRTAEENLGIGYLASILRQTGREVRIVDGWLSGMTTHEIAEIILNDPPKDFLGFACYRSNMERTMEVATLLKEVGLNIPLVVGGFGPTFHTEEFLNAGFDIVVRGEAEETIVDLAKHFEFGEPQLGEILGIAYKSDGKIIVNFPRPLRPDIDDLPFPARDTMQMTIDRRSPVHILSARGCQAHCIFCSIVAFQKIGEGPQWRQRSIKNFIDELQQLNEKGARYFKVIDDSFIESPRNVEWCRQLADEVESRELNIRLRGSIRADRVNDDIMHELCRAGFFAFSCGIENGSATALKRMGKSATLEQNIQALEVFQKYGIYVQAGYILFDHGTTMQELEDNYQFMLKYKWTISKGIFTEMYAANGTPFTRRLEKEGLLIEDQRGLGNNTYPVLDENARKAYFALKDWQKSHTVTYDMTIDAISAPKALETHELELFHPLCIELRERDLAFMRNILDLINQGLSQDQIMEFTNRQIEESRQWYSEFEQRVLQVYKQSGLVYDAEGNPFMC